MTVPIFLLCLPKPRFVRARRAAPGWTSRPAWVRAGKTAQPDGAGSWHAGRLVRRGFLSSPACSPGVKRGRRWRLVAVARYLWKPCGPYMQIRSLTLYPLLWSTGTCLDENLKAVVAFKTDNKILSLDHIRLGWVLY